MMCVCAGELQQSQQPNKKAHTRCWRAICFSKAENPSFRNQLSSWPVQWNLHACVLCVCVCVSVSVLRPFINWCVIIQFLTTQHVNNLTPEIALALVYGFF